MLILPLPRRLPLPPPVRTNVGFLWAHVTTSSRLPGVKRHEILFNDLILLRSRSGVATVAEQTLRVFPTVEKELRLVRLTELLAFQPLLLLLNKMGSQGTASVAEKSGGAGRALALLRAYSRGIANTIHQPHIFYEPDLLALPMGKKRVATICDLSVLMFPQWHPAHRVAAYRQYFDEAVKTTDYFLSISNCSKEDFLKFAKVDPSRVRVAPLAPRPQFVPQDRARIESTQSKLKITKKYFLFLSTLEPRKNIQGLLDAWEELPAPFRREHDLLLVGSWGWRTEGLASRLKQPEIARSVRQMGGLDDVDLVPLVAGAEALVYPSFYEGFGLPPLEAMACGTPVISSDKGALGETVGNAAWIIDPDEPGTIRDALLEIGSQRGDFSARGREWSKKFQWENFARAAAQTFRQAY